MNDFSEKNITGLTIKIDRTTCISTANCIKVAPDIFELDDERICSFVNPAVDTEKDIIIEACSVCPVNALYVLDKEGKQLVP
jgi:ferredoxin